MKIASAAIQLGLSPFPEIVTNRIITFLVGDPYKSSFATMARETIQNITILEYIQIYFGYLGMVQFPFFF